MHKMTDLTRIYTKVWKIHSYSGGFPKKWCQLLLKPELILCDSVSSRKLVEKDTSVSAAQRGDRYVEHPQNTCKASSHWILAFARRNVY